jgi:hypothetical protein
MRGECFPSPVACHNLEFNPCARNKLVRIPVEYRCVQEYVFTIVVRPDKSVTTHMIELKYPARNQLRPPPLQTLCHLAAVRSPAFNRRGAAVEHARRIILLPIE